MASAMAGIEALKGTHQELKSRMEKSVEDFRANLMATRTGRANVHMLDQIKVDYYGTDTPVAQMGQISTPEATLILVQPYDISMVSAIEKAIRTSSVGLNPMTDGKVIRVPVPPMTEERRKDVVKQLQKTLEDHKTAIRNIRRDGNEQIRQGQAHLRRRREARQRRGPAAHRPGDKAHRGPLPRQGKRDSHRLIEKDARVPHVSTLRHGLHKRPGAHPSRLCLARWVGRLLPDGQNRTQTPW
jgi:ribosome recycling factor